MSMIRRRNTSGQAVPTALLLSSRTWRDVLFGDELLAAEKSASGFYFALTLTREPPTRESDFARRIDGEMVADVAGRLPAPPGYVFVCGSNDFVNAAADGALASGIPAAIVRTERYGG
jgi:ferredoxin-NADP reductase